MADLVPSSPSDFYESGDDRRASAVPAPAPVTPPDDEADMDMSASESESDSNSYHPATTHPTSTTLLPTPLPPPPSNDTNLKRKLDDIGHVTNDATTAESSQTQSKKTKTSTDTLPTKKPKNFILLVAPRKVIEQLFAHLHPSDMVNILRVSKICNDRITAVSNPVFGAFRKNTYGSTLPKPMSGMTELQMLQLIGTSSCMDCGKPATAVAEGTSSQLRGPGPNGVRHVWPFQKVLCGPCLKESIYTDTDLLSSTEYPMAQLRMGIPHIFLTPDGHYFTEHQRTSNKIGPNLGAEKVYFQEHVNELVNEYDTVSSQFGDGATEEWRKGLAAKGKQAIQDAQRWESFENSLPSDVLVSDALRWYAPESYPLFHQSRRAPSGAGQHGTSTPPFSHTHLPQNGNGTQEPANTAAQPLQIQSQQTQSQQNGQGNRAPRSREEAEAASIQRKQEIIRRCKQLQPPIDPVMLDHMKAFKTTMMIRRPLGEEEWQMLVPQLRAQLDNAAEEFRKQQETMAALTASANHTFHATYNRPAREVFDEDYEEAQGPLRGQLSQYFDEFVNIEWTGEFPPTQAQVASYLTNSLLYIKKRYDEDEIANPQSMDESDSRPSTPISNPFLSLLNMKWVYDTRIKPPVKHLRLEIFTCAEPDCFTNKMYAFEGFIQHVGAKHNTDFGRGNIVVYWPTAVWPVEPLFKEIPMPKVKPIIPRKSPATRNQGGSTTGHRQGARRSPANHNQGHGKSLMGHNQENGTSRGNGQPESNDGVLNQQVYTFTTIARQIWDALADITDLSDSARTAAVMILTSRRFSQTLAGLPLTTDHVISALALSNNDIQPLQNVSTLYCRPCFASDRVKILSLAGLISHYGVLHGEMDWNRVIDVPEDTVSKVLASNPGMARAKVDLLMEAFPMAFQYDPRRPAFVDNPLQPNTMNVQGDLVALSLRDIAAPSQRERAPSVGAAPTNTTPPDISAILAAIGQTQPGPPPMATNLPGWSAQVSHTPAYVQPYTPAPYANSPERLRASSFAPPAAYAAPPSYPPGYGETNALQAALAHNNQGYGYNRAGSFSAAQPAYSPPRATPSPPRYRQASGSAQQYVQQPYAVPRPASPPQFVDQYGRTFQLAPVDNAPAPVQYVRHQHDSSRRGYHYHQ